MMFSLASCSPPVMNLFTPSMCQVPSPMSIALVVPAPDIRAGVGLGEDHAPRPLLVHPEPGQVFLLLGAFLEEDPGEERTSRIPADTWCWTASSISWVAHMTLGGTGVPPNSDGTPNLSQPPSR